MKNDFLKIEMELLLLKYGEASVVKALAEAQGVSADKLLQNLEDKRKQKRQGTTKARVRKPAIDIARELIEGSENEQLLLDLAGRFQSKSFLPQLKDVKRFAERNGISDNFASRDAAAKPLFEKLRMFSRERIQELLASADSAKESHFAQLSKQLIEGDAE